MRKLRDLCGPVFIAAGINHFVVPKAYDSIIPDYLPAHRQLTYASGVVEAAGGLGLLFPKTRTRAGQLLLATLVAVFPANLNMAQHPERYSFVPGGEKALKARLPFQGVFMLWVLWAMSKKD